MQRTHRGVALDTVFDENGTRRVIQIWDDQSLLWNTPPK